MYNRVPMYLRGNWQTLVVFPAFLIAMAIAALVIAPFAHPVTDHNKESGNSTSIVSPVGDSQGNGTRDANATGNATNANPYVVYLRDCGDTENFPCVTFDENEWRMVTGYQPFTYTVLNVCTNEDGSNNALPCVYVSKNEDDLSPYYVFVRTLTLK